MIEVVSPARTLRFKGETTVEHRLWSDSLHRLCNPPKLAPPKQEAPPPVADHKARDKNPSEATSADTRAASNEAAAAQRRANETREREEQARLAAIARAEREKIKEQAERVDSSHRKRSDSFDRRRRHSSRSNSASDESDEDDYSPRTGRRNSLDKTPSSRKSDHPSSRDQQRNVSRGGDREQPTARQASRESTPRREDGDYERNDRRSPPRSQRQYSSDRNSSSEDDASDSEHERERETKPASSSSDSGRPSMLVAQIKATSARNVSAAEPKSGREQTPAKRDPVTTTAPVEAKDDEQEQHRPTSLSIPLDRTSTAQRTKSSVQHDEDSDDDDPEQETPREESAHEPMDSPPRRAQTEMPSNHKSTVAEEVRPKPAKQTEYFDSDEEGEEQDNHRRSQPLKATSNSKLEPVKAAAAAPASAIDGIARDNNFVEEDWDAEDESPLPKQKALPIHKSPEKVCPPRSLVLSAVA